MAGSLSNQGKYLQRSVSEIRVHIGARPKFRVQIYIGMLNTRCYDINDNAGFKGRVQQQNRKWKLYCFILPLEWGHAEEVPPKWVDLADGFSSSLTLDDEVQSV